MTTWWYAPHLGEADIELRDLRELIGVDEDRPDQAFGYMEAPGANLQGSANGDGTHSIVLDLDCLHEYRTSSTEGHGHLIIPARLSKRRYRRLLKTPCRAGIITPGLPRPCEPAPVGDIRAGARLLQGRRRGRIVSDEA